MTFVAPEPVASGQSYLITEVNGRRPESLDDFTGDIELTAMKDGRRLMLTGGAECHHDAVRFHQKSPGAAERDVRIWTITERGTGTFLGQPFAAF